jgi:hypothetical protein
MQLRGKNQFSNSKPITQTLLYAENIGGGQKIQGVKDFSLINA